jgi:hypothetical protein
MWTIVVAMRITSEIHCISVGWFRFGFLWVEVENTAIFSASQSPDLQGELALHRAQDRLHLFPPDILGRDALPKLEVSNGEPVVGLA